MEQMPFLVFKLPLPDEEGIFWRAPVYWNKEEATWTAYFRIRLQKKEVVIKGKGSTRDSLQRDFDENVIKAFSDHNCAEEILKMEKNSQWPSV